MEAGYRSVRGLPLRTWDRLPTIDKPAVKIEPPPPASFYKDEDLKLMDFRLANKSYYIDNSQKLKDDMTEVNSFSNTMKLSTNESRALLNFDQ